VNGTIDGKLIRQSLKTRVWDVGQKKVREWEAAGMVFVTVKEVWERFVEDCIARGLGDAQLGKHRLMKTEMEKEDQFDSFIVVADDRFQIMSIPSCNPVLGQSPNLISRHVSFPFSCV